MDTSRIAGKGFKTVEEFLRLDQEVQRGFLYVYEWV